MITINDIENLALVVIKVKLWYNWVYDIKKTKKIVNSAIKNIIKIPSKSCKKPNKENKTITRINEINFFLKSENSKKMDQKKINKNK